MLGAALTLGLVIFLGFVFLLVKLSAWRVAWLLGHSMWLDLGATAFGFVLFAGSATGILAAAVAGLMTGIATTVLRWYMGYTYKNDDGDWIYKSGIINIYGRILESGTQ